MKRDLAAEGAHRVLKHHTPWRRTQEFCQLLVEVWPIDESPAIDEYGIARRLPDEQGPTRRDFQRRPAVTGCQCAESIDLDLDLAAGQGGAFEMAAQRLAVGDGAQAQIAKEAHCMDVEADVPVAVRMQHALDARWEFKAKDEVAVQQLIDQARSHVEACVVVAPQPGRGRVGLVFAQHCGGTDLRLEHFQGRRRLHQLHLDAHRWPSPERAQHGAEPAQVAALRVLIVQAVQGQSRQIAGEDDSANGRAEAAAWRCRRLAAARHGAIDPRLRRSDGPDRPPPGATRSRA